MKYYKIFLALFSFFLIVHTYPDASLKLTTRQTCDLELIMNGGFAPLKGFMYQDDYDSVVHTMRLADGTVWPIPIVLDVTKDFAQSIAVNDTIILKGQEGHQLALLHVKNIWKPDKLHEAEKVYGTTSIEHPGVKYLMNNTQEYYIGGEVKKILLPKHYDFLELRRTPDDLKNYFKEKSINTVIAFQTRNPMHKAHVELTLRAMKELNGHLLLHPAVGLTKPGDVDYFTRVKCYKKVIQYYLHDSVTLSLLPIAMRMAGPREALWHAIIRKNYGATHFIIGRDHAGPGKDKNGNDFYGPYDAQQLVKKYEDEIGIKTLLFKQMVYVENTNQYVPEDEVPAHAKILNISGTDLRKMLQAGTEIPPWFSYPEIISELRKVYKEKNKQGFTIFFTGLSGSGKSTLANALAIKLNEIQDRRITLLDGDMVRIEQSFKSKYAETSRRLINRIYLSPELGFSPDHCSINVRRVGFVSNEITKNGGIAICALIAPFEKDRIYNRELISAHGGYIEVYISTPMSVCEQRDEKGLYQKAKEGLITNFAGVNAPYEIPKDAELTIDMSSTQVDDAIDIIVQHLKQQEFIN